METCLGLLIPFNVIAFCLGFLSFIGNGILTYIGLRHKIYEKSIFSMFLTLNSIGGLLIGLSSCGVSIINYIESNSLNAWYSVSQCRTKMGPWVFSYQLYQLSFLFQSLSLVCSIIKPLTYSYYIDTFKTKIISVTIILLCSFISTALLFIPSGDDTRKVQFCTSMDSLSHQFIYKNEACVAIYTIVISMNWVCSFRGARSTFLHTVLGRPVCYQMVYSKLIFLAFTSIPNIAVLVACLVGLSEMLSNILIDVMILTVTISTISTLPFYVFKNKDIRNFFFQLSVVKTVYESYSMSKEPKTTVSMISDLK